MNLGSTPVLTSASTEVNQNHAVLDLEDQDWFSDFDYSDYDAESRFRLPGRIQTECSGYDDEA